MITSAMISVRRWLERQFITMTVKALLAASKRLTFDLSEEGKSTSEPITDASKESIDTLMNYDIIDLYVDGNGWVRFVCGNDGWDVISDYTTNLEDIIAPINKLAVNEDMDELIVAIVLEKK